MPINGKISVQEESSVMNNLQSRVAVYRSVTKVVQSASCWTYKAFISFPKCLKQSGNNLGWLSCIKAYYVLAMAAKFIRCIIYHEHHHSLPIGHPAGNMTLRSEVRVSRAQQIAFFCPSVCELACLAHVPLFMVSAIYIVCKKKKKKRLSENLLMQQQNREKN